MYWKECKEVMDEWEEIRDGREDAEEGERLWEDGK